MEGSGSSVCEADAEIQERVMEAPARFCPWRCKMGLGGSWRSNGQSKFGVTGTHRSV